MLYYNARFYDPQLGIFISPDSMIPDPTDYYSYNRYLYTRGNPLKYNDPTGHENMDGIDLENYPCNYQLCYRDGSGVLVRAPHGVSSTQITPYQTSENVGPTLLFLAENVPYADTGNDLLVATTGCSYSCQLGYEEPVDAGWRIAAGIAVLGPFSISTVRALISGGSEVFTDFRIYDSVISLGKQLPGTTNEHHWFPQALHGQMRNTFGDIFAEELLQFTEPLNSGFHKYLHSKGGNLAEAYNAAVDDLIVDSPNAVEFIRGVKDLRDLYMKAYQSYILEAP